MFFFVNDCFKTWSTHPIKVILFSFIWLFLNKSTFLDVFFNGLKQNTLNGCKACDVWDGKVLMSNPNSYAYFIVFKIRWLAFGG